MYLVRNKFTKDYIDKNGDWTQKKEMAKHFSTNAEARSYINSESEGVMKYVYPQQMEIIKESTTMKSFKQYLKEDWWDNLGPEGQDAYIKAHPNSSKAKNSKANHSDTSSGIKSFISKLFNKSEKNKDVKEDDYNNVKNPYQINWAPKNIRLLKILFQIMMYHNLKKQLHIMLRNMQMVQMK